MNEEDFLIDFKVIDYQVYFGANVDREDNRLRGLRRIQTNRKNF